MSGLQCGTILAGFSISSSRINPQIFEMCVSLIQDWCRITNSSLLRSTSPHQVRCGVQFNSLTIKSKTLIWPTSNPGFVSHHCSHHQPRTRIHSQIKSSQWLVLITAMLDEVAPLKTRSRRPLKVVTRWLLEDAIAAKRHRRRLERKWRDTKSDSDRLAYRRVCRHANKLSNTSRQEYFRAQLSTTNDVKGIIFWSMVSNSGCRCARAMNFFCFLSFLGKKVIPTIADRVTFTCDLHVWPSRVTLKLKITSWSTWLLLSLLVFVLPRWIFCCFVRLLGHRIHSNYRRLRDLHAWPWNWRSRSTWLYVLFSC